MRRERGGGGSGVMCMWCEEGEGRRREWCDVHAWFCVMSICKLTPPLPPPPPPPYLISSGLHIRGFLVCQRLTQAAPKLLPHKLHPLLPLHLTLGTHLLDRFLCLGLCVCTHARERGRDRVNITLGYVEARTAMKTYLLLKVCVQFL